MQITRAELINAAALVSIALPPAWPLAAHAASFYQADDKSWDITLPDTWHTEHGQGRDDPAHFMRVSAVRSATPSARLDVYVDALPGKKSLKELGTLDTLAQRFQSCLLYTSPSPRDQRGSRMPSSA